MHAMDSRVNIHTSICHSPSSAVARLYEEKCSNTVTNPSEVPGVQAKAATVKNQLEFWTNILLSL